MPQLQLRTLGGDSVQKGTQFKASLSYITVQGLSQKPTINQSINQEAVSQSHVFYESSTHLRVLGSNVPGSFRLQEESLYLCPYYYD